MSSKSYTDLVAGDTIVAFDRQLVVTAIEPARNPLAPGAGNNGVRARFDPIEIYGSTVRSIIFAAGDVVELA